VSREPGARSGHGRPVEIVLKPTGSAGRSDGSLNLIMFDLGVALSRALQGRDPRHGAAEVRQGAG